MEVKKEDATVVKTIEVEKLTPERAFMLNSVLRSAGLQVDLPTSAVVHQMMILFLEKGDDVSLKEISSVVATVMNNPQLNPQPKANKETK